MTALRSSKTADEDILENATLVDSSKVPIIAETTQSSLEDIYLESTLVDSVHRRQRENVDAIVIRNLGFQFLFKFC